jgi:hypothetical protein
MKGEIAGERAWTDFGNRGLFEADRYRGLSVLSQSSRKSRVDTFGWLVTVEEKIDIWSVGPKGYGSGVKAQWYLWIDEILVY